jgi:uncharacterized protein (PEP-CTERM system associated)
MVGSATGAEDPKVTAGISVSATATDNVNLAPPGQEQADFYFTITPRLGIQHEAPRFKFNASFAPSIVLYASNASNDQLYSNLSAIANLEAISNFFYIDASANTSQTFLSPFAPQPANIGTTTSNRVTTATFTVSPYIKGVTDSGISYSLRNTDTWTDTSSSAANNVYFLGWTGHADQARGLYSWGVDYEYQNTSYQDQNPLTTELARLRLGYQVDPELGLQLRFGYQTNNYFVAQPDNYIYGLGFNWTPSPRAQVAGYWEQQYFGGSYSLTASYRRRMTAFTLTASRLASTYPQLLFTLPPGNTAALLNAALTARFPDPAERQAAVNQFMQQTGLPPTLTAPYGYYTNTVALVQQSTASIAFLGTHNSVILSAFYVDSQNIVQPGVSLSTPLVNNSDFTSWGPSASYLHDLSPKSKLILTATWTETKSNVQPFIETTSAYVRLSVTTQLGAKTYGSVGVWRNRFASSTATTAVQDAVFATLDHAF